MTTFTISTAARNAACNAIVDLLDQGTGTVSNCVIQTAGGAADLVSISLGATAFGNAATGVAAMTAATATGTASASGTAARFALEDQSGTEVAHGDCGVSSTTMIISNTSINTSDVVQLTAMTVTVPAS